MRKHDKEELPEEQRYQLNSMYENTPRLDKWWLWYKKLEEPYSKWSKFSASNAIMSGTMEKVVKDKIDYLLTVTARMDL